MSRCVSEPVLKKLALASLLSLTLAAAVFYVRQNRMGGFGGEVALPKLLWLACAIIFFFALPALIALDARAGKATRRIYAMFLANMTARGVLELWMLYGARNWHPYYGAAHDAASILLLLFLWRRYPPAAPLDRLLAGNLAMTGVALVFETGFALYFAARFHTAGERALYFVPPRAEYNEVLVFTWFALVLLMMHLILFVRRWLYGFQNAR